MICCFSWFALWMKRRGARHGILEDNPNYPTQSPLHTPQPLASSHVLWIEVPYVNTSLLTVTSLSLDVFPGGLEKILGLEKRTGTATRICHSILTVSALDRSYRTESS